VLRRVAEADVEWPDTATRLSYPDWIVDRLQDDLGADAVAVLEQMDRPPPVTERADGYVQDLASQWVAESVEARAGERVADLCAAPGGKAMILAASGATVVTGDVRAGRARLLRSNAPALPVVTADAAHPPFRRECFDRVLIDAPCSGLGTLRRRADARWRIDEAAPERLAAVQRDLLAAAVALIRPGGVLAYSVCTLTNVEGPSAAERLVAAHPGLVPLDAPLIGGPWQAAGAIGHRLLPHQTDSDGMYLARFRKG
jgi:16S rRNA (cytosine967-C5)-methyltransferase